ncbi:unnamed protein product [Polarella glacialis]|uniref:Cyclin-dependent kinase 2 homolog n=1 Tax=Polarella glacialis TaxID=89957 RepID=A0A813G563_POLGL|nr:unnamed protein product [Polarella glacialis]
MEGPRRLQIAGCRFSVVPGAAMQNLAAGGVGSTAAGFDQIADLIRSQRDLIRSQQDLIRSQQNDAEIKGQYIFMEIIGSGSYGTVFKAIKKTTGRRVAIKKMYGSQADEGVPASALREIALLKDLSHVNVIRLYEVFSALGTCTWSWRSWTWIFVSTWSSMGPCRMHGSRVRRSNVSLAWHIVTEGWFCTVT